MVEEGHQPRHHLDVEGGGTESLTSMVSKSPNILPGDLGNGKIPNVVQEPSKLRHRGVSSLLSLPPTSRPLFPLVVIYGF
jgi:hypothetical protein